jgi:2-amino-4-hydroxy-6-hydroxymethyldihydropteridine diphosphokinase
VPRIYVGAGSNSEPVERLRAAVAALEGAFGAVRCSSTYRSAAVGAPAPDYLNLVVAFDSAGAPDRIKAELTAIEAAMGRTRARSDSTLCELDLDLLIHGSRVDAERRLPHPDVLQRAFALGPLAELAPQLIHPVTGERLAAAWARLVESKPSSAGAIERVGSLESIG